MLDMIFLFSLYIADRQQDYKLLTITHTTAFSHQSTHVSPHTADKNKRSIIVALYDMHGEACVFCVMTSANVFVQ